MGNGNKTNERIQAKLKNPIIGTIVFLYIQQWQVQLGRVSLNPSDLCSKWGELNFQDLQDPAVWTTISVHLNFWLQRSEWNNIFVTFYIRLPRSRNERAASAPRPLLYFCSAANNGLGWVIRKGRVNTGLCNVNLNLILSAIMYGAGQRMLLCGIVRCNCERRCDGRGLCSSFNLRWVFCSKVHRTFIGSCCKI